MDLYGGGAKFLTENDVTGGNLNLLVNSLSADSFSVSSGETESLQDTFPNSTLPIKSNFGIHFWGTKCSFNYAKSIFLTKGIYVFSFLYRFNDDTDEFTKLNFKFSITGNKQTLGESTFPGSSGKSTKFGKIVFEVKQDTLFNSLIVSKTDSFGFPGGSMYITDCKLETGSIATPWSYSLEDLKAEIDQLKQSK
jgi:hypothetical protein